MGILKNWWETTKKSGTDPAGFYKIAERYEGLEFPVRYLSISVLLLSIIYSIGFLVYSILTQGFGLGMFISVATQFIGVLVGTTVFLCLYASIMHVSLMLMGGKNWRDTFRIVALSTGILALVGAIPLVNILALFYMAYMQYFGIRVMHRTSKTKTVIALIITGFLTLLLPLIIIVTVVGGAIAALFL